MLAREMSPYPVAVRTLDLGAEDGWSGVDLSGQNNPSMGLRGIRLSLVREELFAARSRRSCAPAAAGKVEIVLPMVASVEEVREAKAIIASLRETVCSRRAGAVGRCCAHRGDGRGARRRHRTGSRWRGESTFFASGRMTSSNTCWQSIEAIQGSPIFSSRFTRRCSNPSAADRLGRCRPEKAGAHLRGDVREPGLCSAARWAWGSRNSA